MSKIISLQVENVKRLKAISITPDGNLVVIGGRNGQGKSSLLDSISMGLGGADRVPGVPIRQGEKSAKIVIDTGDVIVERTFTEGGNTYLSVKTKDGAKFPSPQAMIDRLVGPQFDPQEFSRLDAKRQLEMLKSLLGVDFTALDKERAGLFSERTEANRYFKAAKTTLDTMPLHADVPTERVSIDALLQEQQQMNETRRKNDAERTKLRELDTATVTYKGELGELADTVERLKEELKKVENLHAKLVQEAKDHEAIVASQQAIVAALVDPDLSVTQVKVREAQAINARIEANALRQVKAKEVETLGARADKLTKQIDDIDATKQKQLAEAKFPVPGLGMSDHGVTFNGLPFDQASSAEKLRVSMAMGLAMNPKLRVLLIRDGSLLDEESLAIVAEMAATADAQVWIERVGKGEEVTLIIEDGMVQAKPEPDEAKSEARGEALFNDK